MDKFGNLIRSKRLEKKETIESLAKFLDVSLTFANQIETAKIVPVSDRIVEKLAKHYRLKRDLIDKLAESRNRVGKAYYSNYRAKRQSA